MSKLGSAPLSAETGILRKPGLSDTRDSIPFCYYRLLEDGFLDALRNSSSEEAILQVLHNADQHIDDDLGMTGTSTNPEGTPVPLPDDSEVQTEDELPAVAKLSSSDDLKTVEEVETHEDLPQVGQTEVEGEGDGKTTVD